MFRCKGNVSLYTIINHGWYGFTEAKKIKQINSFLALRTRIYGSLASTKGIQAKVSSINLNF